MTQADSQLIKWLRFPLTLGVVCLHCMGNVEIDWGALGTKDIPGLVKMTMSGCIIANSLSNSGQRSVHVLVRAPFTPVEM
jgi:hypothetical protein